jgi:outer membrane lipoprotein
LLWQIEYGKFQNPTNGHPAPPALYRELPYLIAGLTDFGASSMRIQMQPCWRTARRPVFIPSTLCTLVLLLNACAPVISPQLMEQVDRNLTYGALASRPDESRGKIVLLGGTIVQTVPKPTETEIEVVQKPVSTSGEPYLTDKSEGRYLVVVDRFLDPAIYSAGRDVTVAGKVQSSVTRRLGEIDYRYPVIGALELYLWKNPLSSQAYPYPYPYSYPYYRRWWLYPGYPY